MPYLKMSSVLLSLLLLLSVARPNSLCAERQMPARKDTRVKDTPRDKKEVRKAKVSATRQMKTLPESEWAGPQIRLSINESGTVIEYDCAHGTIDQSIELDSEGQFDVRGTHEDESGGPTQDITIVDEDGKTRSSATSDKVQPARYIGRITAQKMTLTVTLINTGRDIGTFELIQGASTRLHKCQ